MALGLSAYVKTQSDWWLGVSWGNADGSNFIGWFIQNLSSLFLKAFTDGAETTSPGKLFHASTVEFVKKFRYLFELHRCLVSLNPLDLVLDSCRKCISLCVQTSLAYLNTFIISPLRCLKATDGNPNCRNRSGYGTSLNSGTFDDCRELNFLTGEGERRKPVKIDKYFNHNSGAHSIMQATY